MKKLFLFVFAVIGLFTITLITHKQPAGAANNTFCLVYNNPAYPCAPATPTPTPAPVPTPTPTPLANCTNGNFSAPNAYPDACYQPYAVTSVWNTPIGTPSPNPSSSTWQSYYAGSTLFFPNISFGYLDQNNQYQHPIYFGRSTDPTYHVTCNASYAICNQFSSMTWHLPTYAIPAHGFAANGEYADHHMAVVDQTDNDELDCFRVYSTSGGIINADSCTHAAVTGTGIGGQETASGFRLWAGVIRAQELIAGNIPHALFIAAPCTNNNTPVYPSGYRDSTDTQCTSNQGAPYGARFRLNMTVAQINALSIPASHKTILIALSQYGGYNADTNNNNYFELQFEADPMYTAAGYTNANCPTNSPASGIPCTPLTAWEHANGDPDWNGSRYGIDLHNDVNWATAGQWLNPPAQ